MHLKRLLPSTLKRNIKQRVRNRLGLFVTGTAAFSQEGEDLVLSRLLGVCEGRPVGFYVDVGAHHPERYSNTRYFYERGWRGINIDPAPGVASMFAAARPRDISVQIAISDAEGTIEYAVFNDFALNGCDLELAAKRNGQNGHRVTEVLQVPARRLADVLAEHLPSAMPIDFLSVDVEGHDLAVLQSNDWDRFRPHLVVAEDAEAATLDEASRCVISQFMVGHGYRPVSKCALSIIYAEESRIRRTPLGLRVS